MGPVRGLLVLGLLAAAAGICSVGAAPLKKGDVTQADLKQLVRDNPKEAEDAYLACMKHGAACHIPCKTINNCAGCHPDTDGLAAVCAYCMPGHVLSADQQSCEACPPGSTSKGGKATTCTDPSGKSVLMPSNPVTAQQAVTLNCSLPVPSDLFVPDPDKCYKPSEWFTKDKDVCFGICNRANITAACMSPNTEVRDGQECKFQCYKGHFGDSKAICRNGTWVPGANSCSWQSYCQGGSGACYSSGVYTSICIPTGGLTKRCTCQFGASYLEGYGCVTDLTFEGNRPLSEQRCAVRLTENPAHYEACDTSPTYPGPSSTKCTQVSIASGPIRSNCKLGNNCTSEGKGCWVQTWPGQAELSDGTYEANYLPGGWIQSGPSCQDNTYSYLAPCPAAQCRTAPSSEVCTVKSAGGLKMRTAPCPKAPVAKKGIAEVVIPNGASFTYLDRNSRQSADCAGYGYDSPQGNFYGLFEPDYCWVLGSYDGVTGWVPVLKNAEYGGSSPATYDRWTSALCTYADPRSSEAPDTIRVTPLVADDGSATGCAELTRDLQIATVHPSCFPADATVLLRDGQHKQLSRLHLGDEVAIRTKEGSVNWEPIYAFGHRDNRTEASFVQLTAVYQAQEGWAMHASIEASPDHFMLVGADKPTYNRAGRIVVGDTLWVIADASKSTLRPAQVTATKTVTKRGLYAPLTLSGSIIVDSVAASVHSAWFADAAWAAAGLPDSWLHTFYQAVLAPVRVLWHMWPRYNEFYAHFDTAYDLATSSTSLWGLCTILLQAFSYLVFDVVKQTVPTVLVAVAIGLAALLQPWSQQGPSKGTMWSKRRTAVAIPLLVLLCAILVSVAQGARIEGAEVERGVADEAELAKAKRGGHQYPFGKRTDKAPSNYHGEPRKSPPSEMPEQPYWSYKDHNEGYPEPPAEYDEPYGNHNKEYYPRRYEGPAGCHHPPPKLDAGSWSCPSMYGTVPVGAKCTAQCQELGWAEITCRHHGWSPVSGGCQRLTRKVCAGLPTADPGTGFWPQSCHNTAVGDYCVGQCTGAACQRSTLFLSRCTKDGWSGIVGPGGASADPLPCADTTRCIVPDRFDNNLGFWSDSCREAGLAVNGTCAGQCYGPQAGNTPLLTCTANGVVANFTDSCLPPGEN